MVISNAAITQGKSFYYTVHTCKVMNEIRRNLTEPVIDCKDEKKINDTLNQISVANKVLYAFFDPFA